MCEWIELAIGMYSRRWIEKRIWEKSMRKNKEDEKKNIQIVKIRMRGLCSSRLREKLTTSEITQRPNSQEKRSRRRTEKLALTCSTTGLIRQSDYWKRTKHLLLTWSTIIPFTHFRETQIKVNEKGTVPLIWTTSWEHKTWFHCGCVAELLNWLGPKIRNPRLILVGGSLSSS